MSDLFGGIIEDLSAAYGDIEAPRSLLGEAVRQGLEEGLSANAMYREIVGSELGIQRSRFLGLVRDIRAEQSAYGAPPPFSLDTLPSNESIGQVRGGREGTFRTQITVRYDTRLETGEYVTERTTFSVSSEELLTPNEAIQIAMDVWSTNAEAYPGREILDLSYAGTLQQMGATWAP